VEVSGYKNILNLPDFQNTEYRSINQETQAGSAEKFLSAADFSYRHQPAGRHRGNLYEFLSSGAISWHSAGMQRLPSRYRGRGGMRHTGKSAGTGLLLPRLKKRAGEYPEAQEESNAY
jgi:hypothetical protein